MAAPSKPWRPHPLPSWVFLAAVGLLLFSCVVLARLAPARFWNPPDPPFELDDTRCQDPAVAQSGYGFFYDYYWKPILCDEGYNRVNTATLVVLAALLLPWAYLFLRERGERLSPSLYLAALPLFLGASVFRVLEDADLFAPYAGRSRDLGFLGHNLEVFFVSPFVFLEWAALGAAGLVLGHAARRVATLRGRRAGLQFYGLSLLTLFALYVAVWAAQPPHVRFLAHPAIPLAVALVLFFLVAREARRREALDPHTVLLSYGLLFLLVGLYYVATWLMGGAGDWRPAPDAPRHPWILLAFVAAPGLLVLATWRTGLALAHPVRTRRPALLAPFFLLLLLWAAGMLFLMVLGLATLFDGPATRQQGLNGALLLAAGPVAVLVAPLLARRWASAYRVGDPALGMYADPINLLVIFAQSADGFLTGLGLDLYRYEEEHVVPNALIEQVRQANLPFPFGGYPASVIMIPLKFLLAVAVVYALDRWILRELPGVELGVRLVKLGVIFLGISPAARDAVRLSMGV